MDIDCHGSSMDSRLLLTAGHPIQLDAPFAHRQGHLRGPPEWAFRPPTRLPRQPARQHGLFAHRHGHLVRQHEQPTRQRGLSAHRHEYLVNLLASMGFSPTDTDTSSASMSNLLASVGYSPIDTNTSSTCSPAWAFRPPTRTPRPPA